MISCECDFVVSSLRFYPHSATLKKRDLYETSCIEAIAILRQTYSKFQFVSYEMKGLDKNNHPHTYTSSFEKPILAASRIETFMRNPELIPKANDKKISER